MTALQQEVSHLEQQSLSASSVTLSARTRAMQALWGSFGLLAAFHALIGAVWIYLGDGSKNPAWLIDDLNTARSSLVSPWENASGLQNGSTQQITQSTPAANDSTQKITA